MIGQEARDNGHKNKQEILPECKKALFKKKL